MGLILAIYTNDAYQEVHLPLIDNADYDLLLRANAYGLRRDIHIFMDVLVPSIKKALSDIVKDGIDMILYGDKRSGNRSNSSRGSYRDYSSGSGRRENNRSTRTNYDFADLVYDTRSEAESVLASMDEIMDTYNVVTVADMYDLSGVTCNYTDNKYGWMNISNAQVIHGRDGYIIKMPRVVSID